MTVNQLIAKLNQVVNGDPERGKLPIKIYISDLNEVIDIDGVDNSILDRVEVYSVDIVGF